MLKTETLVHGSWFMVHRKKGFTLKHSINSGFTLIEIMVSIGIMAVLSAGIVSLIGEGPRRSARDARRWADLNKIASALELYRTDTSGYPMGSGIATLNVLTTSYISAIPTDPQNSTYTYTYTGTGSTYSICSNHFERQVNGVNGCTSATNCCVVNP